MLTSQPTSRLAAGMRRVRPVAPLLIVNAFAVLGQIFYGMDHYAPADWPSEARLAVAIGAAVGLESVALYVSWHAHDALLMKASATAARMRRAAYLIAFGVAAINYAHFAPDWAPTGAAIVFAGFSASSPWLWGLHTRRAHHIQLIREGQIDATGAVFSAERWRAFPVRTWKARRWSIDYGINDPRQAWQGYNATHQQAPMQPTADLMAEQTTPEPERVALHLAPEPNTAVPTPAVAIPMVKRTSPASTRQSTSRASVAPDLAKRAAPLIAQGFGRSTLAGELGISTTQARKLLDDAKASQ